MKAEKHDVLIKAHDCLALIRSLGKQTLCFYIFNGG